MQVYEKLDLPIKSQCSQDIPLTIQQTLLYFWKASHKFVHTSPELSQSLLRSFVELSRESCAEYPSMVTQRICSQCCTLLLPGLTATCRLKTTSSNKRRKRRRKAEDFDKSPKPKNEILVTCITCQTKQEPVCGWYKGKGTDVGGGGSGENDVSPVPNAMKALHQQSVLGSSASSVFGDSFIPLGSSSGNAGSLSRFVAGPRDVKVSAGTGTVAGKTSGFNFLGKKLTPPPQATISTISPVAGLFNRTLGGSSRVDTGGPATGVGTADKAGDDSSNSTGPIDLIALEKQQKKLKKKRLSFSSA